MNVVNKIWGRISYAGIHPGLNRALKNKIILTNRFALFACLFAFVTGFTFIKVPVIFSIFVLSFFVYASALFFNMIHWYELSRLILVVTAPLFNLIVGGLITTDTNTSNRFTFIVLILCPALVYQVTEKYKMIAGVLWLCILYILSDKINSIIPRLPEIKFDTEYDNSSLILYRGLATMLLMLAAFLYLMLINRKTEITLAASLQHTKEKNKLIQEKSLELENANKILQEQRREIEIMNNALRSQLIKAQLDPHFMYNALNSIQYFIMQNDAPAALGYLSKFSKLMRQVLENSINETVPVADEIKALTYYLDLEKMRFSNSFNYVIDIDGNIDQENAEIPSMLLQPYLENAIVHGMRNKEKDGLIRLIMMLQADAILCVIQDNGMGRVTEHNKNNAHKNHKSRATEASLKRLALLQNGAGIITIDLKNEDGRPAGTRVEIKIPLSL
jgi:hypothetical protein